MGITLPVTNEQSEVSASTEATFRNGRRGGRNARLEHPYSAHGGTGKPDRYGSDLHPGTQLAAEDPRCLPGGNGAIQKADHGDRQDDHPGQDCHQSNLPAAADAHECSQVDPSWKGD